MSYEHGTRSQYVHRRCRCDPCINANRAYHRKRKQSLPVGYVFQRDSRERVLERFLARVDRESSDCWLFSPLTPGGYGQFAVGGVNGPAHRVSHQLFKGPIPPDREIDHLCRVRACVNPQHLEAVTHQENVQRAYNAKREAT